MNLTKLLFPVFVTAVLGLPQPGKSNCGSKPPAFFLAGDSTTATNGGWGDGFLPLLVKNATGTNYGHSGATTVSFVNDGDWARVIKTVQESKRAYRPYVTLQFGHNDQKAEKNISVAQFEENLTKFVKEVRVAGGIPVLVTSLTRRTFKDGKVVENLAVQANATLSVAAKTKAASIDLNRASTDYVNSIGSKNADLYNWGPGDRTHLNWPGTVVFANLVGKLILKSQIGKDVKDYIRLNETIVSAINEGRFILPANKTSTT